MGRKITREMRELFATVAELHKDYGISKDLLVDYIWHTPDLRRGMEDKFVYSDAGAARARKRNEKMTGEQRSASARHASRARWMKERGWDMWPGIKVIDRSHHDGNGSGNGVAANGGAS